jgi:hypothetical protein
MEQRKEEIKGSAAGQGTRSIQRAASPSSAILQHPFYPIKQTIGSEMSRTSAEGFQPVE